MWKVRNNSTTMATTTSSMMLGRKLNIHDIYLSSHTKTFEFDEQLPSLPVPPLQQTLDRYLRWLKPHVTQEEYEHTEKIVADFRNGIGQELQAKLVQQSQEKRNWLEEWWYNYAYLSNRSSLIPLCNTTGPQSLNLSIWPPSHQKSLMHGSIYLWTLLDFFEILRDEKLKPQASAKGKQLSMEQYRRLFNTTRIPRPGIDSIFTCWKTRAEGECPKDMVVLCNGYIWHMYPWHANGKSMTPPELEVQLKYIREASDEMGPGPSIAVLTCDSRDAWAENREQLKSLSVQNSKNLDLIESSMFVFVLDNENPEDFQQLCHLGLCGDTCNRWADKSLSGIVTRNGCGTMNCDHTPFDAMVTVVLAHYQYEVVSEMNGEWTGSQVVRDSPMPTLLTFDVDDKIENAIVAAKEKSRILGNDVSVTYSTSIDVGKNWLKENKLHPDAFVQMCLQLVYIKLHGKPASTYETATTRQFYHGRTETMRSCTQESTLWAQTMLNPKTTAAEKQKLLRAAIDTHKELMTECQKNEGVDRHLLGLYIIALEEGIPIHDIFTDLSFTKSGGGGNYVLSTSTTGYTPIVGGVVPMVTDGYGCFYSILPEKVNFFITSFQSSKETDGKKFTEMVLQSLQDMKNVIATPTANL